MSRSKPSWNPFRSSSQNQKPPSNPHNWPNSKLSDIEDRPNRIISIGKPQIFSFRNNFVKTSKYELWNFLPKFLLEEFNPKNKLANCYFLVISCLQCIPAISNTGGIPTTLLPLTFVVSISAIFQVLEDLSRHRADKKANSSNTRKYSNIIKEFYDCQWDELEVGDFVRVDTRETIPADVVIIAVAEKSEPAQGICYVETKSLDGETNLKIRLALPSTLSKVKGPADLDSLVGEVHMEHPNKLIDSFKGVIELTNLGKDPIQTSNILLRGCVLRNVDWMIGLVINTGHDTKIMMSTNKTPSKTSNLEEKASSEILKIIILLAILCFSGATGNAIWNSVNNMNNIWYLQWNHNPVGYWFIDFFYYFLLHATFIPVSLYVSMSMVRYFQTYFMNKDLDMYYERIDQPAEVRTMTLNEELGQITHIFSDKTGTLTCNIMDFRKASINGVSYGEGITEIGKAAWKLQGKPIPANVLEGEKKAKENSVPHVAFYSPLFEEDRKRGGSQKDKIDLFYRTLAICHDVIPEKIDNVVKLSASSPDDEALVCAAGYFGFQFKDRQEKFCIIFNTEEQKEERIEILNIIEFSSKRKRMSVIIKDTDHQIKILSKGADTVMLPRFKPGQDAILKQTELQMKEYSTEGLRCLFVGQAIIKEKDYQIWFEKYFQATTDLKEIERKKKGENNMIESLEDQIEKGFTLLGVTAIEDKLQDGVPECIAELAQAGLIIWVLTGDKEETAINIAVACNLVLPKEYMDQIIINHTKCPTPQSMKEYLKSEIQRYDSDLLNEEDQGNSMKPRALVIDGPSLIEAMLDFSEDGLRDLLLDFTQRCKAVVACRVSPDQKREMVHLIKHGVPNVRSLAIGDGANDVPMIQEAHIGVGIRGEEGLQAVNSSDYAIAQFRYLSELLLKHGRSNYQRMSYLVCYMFYKNILMSTAQFWFNFTNAFSGQKYYTEGAIQLFNLAYTSVPILLTGSYDRDVSAKAVHMFPKLYQSGIQDEFFKPIIFWNWIISAVFESVIMSVLPMYLLYNNEVTFWEPGALCLTAIVVVANLKIFFFQSEWYNFSFAFIILSILVYFCSLYFITSFSSLDFSFYHVFIVLTGQGDFWLGLLLLTTIIFAKDIYLSGIERNFSFKPRHIVQELELYGKINQEILDHPSLKKQNMVETETSVKSHKVEVQSPHEVESAHPIHLKNAWENNIKLS